MSEQLKKHITLTKASEETGVPYTTLYRRGKEQKFKLKKIGEALYVEVESLNQWLESTTVRASA